MSSASARRHLAYRPPPLGLLHHDIRGAKRPEPSHQLLLDIASRLTHALADLGIDGRVAQINPGPVVTVYEFVPKRGTKVSKVEALSKDVAMALEAVKVRIVAPIPGKSAIGFEVPNRKRQTVFLKEILCDDGFSGAKSPLQMGLGCDIEGRPVSIDLQKMPHLLVAGTTGSGKSVSINAMLVSLLFKSSPEDLRLILIDPKMLEFSTYEGIPHLLLPIVTDPKKASLVLRWACEEMERRYETLMHAGVRNVESYNRKVAEAVEAAMKGTVPAAEMLGLGEQTAPQKLPSIVIVIDEFSDLMTVASKEVASSVMRLAQKARAAGIHLVLATQRSNRSVINGVIKANLPSRIAFQVPSSADSRVILDENGAETLLGRGDMLFSDRGATLRRLHGALVTEDEVHSVVEHVKKQGKPNYDLDILRAPVDAGLGGAPVDDQPDQIYAAAVRHVAETRQVSVSGVQRKFKIGYKRASRLVERMERESIVGPQEGIMPQEVLVGTPTAVHAIRSEAMADTSWDRKLEEDMVRWVGRQLGIELKRSKVVVGKRSDDRSAVHFEFDGVSISPRVLVLASAAGALKAGQEHKLFRDAAVLLRVRGSRRIMVFTDKPVWDAFVNTCDGLLDVSRIEPMFYRLSGAKRTRLSGIRQKAKAEVGDLGKPTSVPGRRH